MSLRKRFDEQLPRLVIGEDGVIQLEGRRVLVVSADFLTAVLSAGEKVVGPAIGGILYFAGELSGRLFGERARAEAPGARLEDLVVNVMASLEVRGLGRVEIADLDATAGTGILRLLRSPYADALPGRDRPVCYSLMGLWGGVLSGVSGREVTAEEVLCRAKGDPICEIVAGPRTD
jgi:predicted hydrocarbon binding protein